MKLKILLITCILLSLSVVLPTPAQTQSTNTASEKQEVFEGSIRKVSKEEIREVMGRTQLYQKLEVFVTSGSLRGKKVSIENGNLPIINLQKYKIGEEIKFSSSTDPQLGTFYYITDYVRRNTLLKLFLLFVLVVVIVAGIRGLTSIVGMGI